MQIKYLLIIILIMLPHQAKAYCEGRWPNPISDICWNCMLPITIGSFEISSGGTKDYTEKPPLICQCKYDHFPYYRMGNGIGFWEPNRIAEVVKDPFCFPVMGGGKNDKKDTGSGGASGGGADSYKTKYRKGDQHRTSDRSKQFAAYQVHWLKYPLLNWMGFLTDGNCKSIKGDFDALMMSEIDPVWNDDELAGTFSNPEVMLFTSIPAQLVCIADCVAATTTAPLDPLFWCAGCQGHLYPLTGNVLGRDYGLQASLVAVQRMHSVLARRIQAMDNGSRKSMCYSIPMPILRKSHFKTQMVYPIPMTQKSYNYGQSYFLWGAGKEIPVMGEDFAYIIWSKRLCCM
jgi:conjugal transfer pilus assembly protein TraU